MALPASAARQTLITIGVLDNLSVPKTAAFGNSRRIYAGFLGDGGWGELSAARAGAR